jgi:tripartite ATP-independent periplasmic transporter solute receptor, DctP family
VKRKSVALLLVLLLVAAIATGCGGTQNATPGKTVNLKLGHGHPTTSEFHLGAQKFAELVEKKTNGAVKISIYHSGQLGDEQELSEGIRMGTIDLALLGSSSVSKFEPSFMMFDLPFIFRDSAHADKVLDGEIGTIFANKFEQKGLKVLSYWESGFRHYLNNKRPLKTPKDLEGLKIRVPQSPIQVATAQALGASPVPLNFNELYMACQQGTVDGQEGPIFAIKSAKFYEVQKYMVLDGHIYTVMVLGMNPKRFASLSPENQKAVLEAAQEAGLYERKLIRDHEQEQIAFLEKEGRMIIEKNPDKSEWLKATKPVYDEFSQKLDGNLIQRVINTR